MTAEDRAAFARFGNLLLEATEVMRELRDAVRELNRRMAVQDARDSVAEE